MVGICLDGIGICFDGTIVRVERSDELEVCAGGTRAGGFVLVLVFLAGGGAEGGAESTLVG